MATDSIIDAFLAEAQAELDTAVIEAPVTELEREPEAVAEPVAAEPEAVATPEPSIEEDRFTVVDATEPAQPVAAEVPAYEPQATPEAAKPEPERPQFANSESEALFEMLKAGKIEEVKDLLNAHLADYSRLSPVDKIKEQLRRQSPDLDDNDIADYLQDKYHLYKEDDAEYDERAAKKGRVALKMDASAAQSYLDSTKKGLQIPDQFKTPNLNINSEEVIATYLKGEEARQVEVQKEAGQKWQHSVDTALVDIPPLRFKLSDGKEAEFKLTAAEKLELKTKLRTTSVATLFTELGWVDKDGKENLQKLATDIYLLNNRDTIVRGATQQAAVAQKVKMLSEMSNADLNRTVPGTSTLTDRQIDDKFVDDVLFRKR